MEKLINILINIQINILINIQMNKDEKEDINEEKRKIRKEKFNGFCTIQNLQLESEKNLFIKEWCNKKIKYCYFKGYNWKVQNALKAIKNTIEWRKKIKIHEITMDKIEPFMKKFDNNPMMYHHGFDRSGRPIIWVHLVNSKPFLQAEDKNNNDKFNFTLWFFESVRKVMPKHVISSIIIIDMKGFDLGFSLLMGGIISRLKSFPDHNPEFLYKAYVVNAGSFFTVLFKLFDLFLSSRTNLKFKHFQNFNDLKKVIPEKYLLKQFGGKDTFKYSFCKNYKYWK